MTLGGRLLAAGLLVVATWTYASADQTDLATLLKPLDLAGYRAGTRAPAFSGLTLEVRPLALENVRGKVVILNFWASWCVECRPEMPVFESLHRALASRGLAVIGVNAREDRQVVARYASELGLTFPLVLDPAGKNQERYGVVGIPTTFVIGCDGRAVALAVGPRDWRSAAARALLDRLLAEPVPRP